MSSQKSSEHREPQLSNELTIRTTSSRSESIVEQIISDWSINETTMDENIRTTLHDIKDMKIITDLQINNMRKLSKEKMLKIIHLYNEMRKILLSVLDDRYDKLCSSKKTNPA